MEILSEENMIDLRNGENNISKSIKKTLLEDDLQESIEAQKLRNLDSLPAVIARYV